jgi:hypothetical protein
MRLFTPFDKLRVNGYEGLCLEAVRAEPVEVRTCIGP